MMLPHVVRFNAVGASDGYANALGIDAAALASRLEQLLDAGRIRRRLSDHDIPETSLPMLAAEAAKQWTATFNPRPVSQADLLALYRADY